MELDHDACYRAVLARDRRFDGRFFTAVRTTGIYCRPICPARTPRSENVVFYPTAAAAQEAGYRPCLRCRPESSPDLAAWHGTSASVSRALALIDDGALDGGGVPALAGRLGMGERHLRRLFRLHLGASPIAVAQSRRALFARQLIVETGMPLADIAMAAGFGSVRRFNTTFQTLYDRPPRDMRRQANGMPPPGSSAVRLRLAYMPPYDWGAMTAFLARRAIPGVEQVEIGGSYRRAFVTSRGQGIVEVTPGQDGCSLVAAIEGVDIRSLYPLVQRLRRLFDLSADPETIGAHLSSDPLLAPLVAARPGLRVPGAWSGFELAIRAVLGQQITLVAAMGLTARLVERHGQPLLSDAAGLRLLFPAPESLLDADFAALGMPRQRALCLHAVVAAAVAEPDLFERPAGDLAAIEARLGQLPGVGPWTAAYIAMRALAEPDAFPAADAGLIRAIGDLRGGDRPDLQTLYCLAEAWRPWRAYAVMHLWQALADLDPAARPRSSFSAESADVAYDAA